VCLVFAGASFAAALFSDPVPQLPRGFATYVPTNTGKLGVSEPEIRYSSDVEVFGRATSLSWSSDHGFLIAAAVFVAVGLATYGVATRAR